MTITLPDEWRERLETRAKLHGFASVDEYLLSLAEAAESVGESGPPEISPRSRAELDAMLDAGMASGPPIRATPEFWAERELELNRGVAHLS
jgi:hypothetical protein